MPHALWRKLPENRRAKLLGAMKGKGLFWLTNLHKRQIGVLASQLNIPTRRIFEHFQELRKQGVGDRTLGDRVIQDLTEIRDLMHQTNLQPGKLKQALQYRPLLSIMEEMRQHAEQMQAMQQKQPADTQLKKAV